MGSLLAKPEVSKVVERHGHHHLSSAVCSINGHRMSMEDAHCMFTSQSSTTEASSSSSSAGSGSPPHSTFGVFDGHVNSSCAEFVAEAMPSAIERLPRPLCKTALEGTFIDIDSRYLDDDRDGGCTACVCIIEPLTAASFTCTVCNTGDSRLLVIRKGQLIFATKDHKPTLPEEEERIERAGGRVELERVNGDLALSRAMGDGRFKMGNLGPRNEMVICVPDISTIELQPDDLVIVSCDGVFEGNFDNNQVVEYVNAKFADQAGSADLAVVCAAICDESVKRGSKDNITCMMIKVSAAGVDAIQRYGVKSFVPGSPPPVKSDTPAREQFEYMCQMAGVTVADALAKRFELLQNRSALIAPRFSELESHAFDTMSEEDIQAETHWFGGGPPIDATQEQKTQWFDNLWGPVAKKSLSQSDDDY